MGSCGCGKAPTDGPATLARRGDNIDQDPIDAARQFIDLEWQSVDDAWKTLVRRHDAFVVDTDGDEKRLTISSIDDISTGLVGIVEDSLGRDDLTKRFVGGGD